MTAANARGTHGISEAASKNRRGRPRRFPDKAINFVLAGSGRCRRAGINDVFSGIALRLLGADEQARLPSELAWLQKKRGLLEQLGRLSECADTATVRSFALALCELKPPVKAGIERLRQVRLKHMHRLGTSPAENRAK